MTELCGQTSAGATFYHATLPDDGNLSLKFPRMTTEKTGIFGNIIRQSSVKQTSVGVGRYARLTPNADAEIVYNMDLVLTNAYLSFAGKCYLVEFDAFVHDKEIDGKKMVEIDFKVVSRVWPEE